MFDLARQALVAWRRNVPGYRSAASRPDKFCHGFGMFQRDLQFFMNDPDHFLGAPLCELRAPRSPTAWAS